MSPATNYVLTISPFLNLYDEDAPVGPEAKVAVRTPGKALPKPQIINAMITKNSNSIKLTWKLKDDEKRKNDNWQFGIFYGLRQVPSSS